MNDEKDLKIEALKTEIKQLTGELEYLIDAVMDSRLAVIRADELMKKLQEKAK